MTTLEELRHRLHGRIPTIVTSVILLILVVSLFYLLFKTLQLERKHHQIWENSQLDEDLPRLRADISKLDQGYSDLNTNVSQLDETYNVLLTSREMSAQIDQVVPGLRRLLNSLIRNQHSIICPEGWLMFAKQCFFFSTNSVAWRSANRSCTNVHATLAIVTSLQLQNFIISYDSFSRWIGLTDLEKVGAYHWVDGTPLVTGFWARGEPNHRGVERCVTKGAKGNRRRWSNNQCTAHRRWICQMSSFQHLLRSFDLGAVLN
ncbi:CD209 antigen-like protein C isoform X1 [Scyliorhinus canicula]|uniref:CD209 antigen-like protein C isoform X1 n=1 Tax=Scyliorhinus canicula TaxID=7830 RepID=UPI0018F54A3B|nr:CD209 antigen-like protein C isoform X1 [Scyliorhinus canicula]XP_038636967.1 CD209 antigen-like protein C isoform X1 [Scyliorhinus canicula]XP_038636968.1 CD209 antigen-like protein C isoform X1 [Scyliorhinus canicula]XP_038636969.1 CD209 antigen-like protein C isoform X1 [Scyliorhinus canicula]XP_038636970.1 CD209 antigen-like protein C isoform X1 [Scyliorhinus canicula]